MYQCCNEVDESPYGPVISSEIKLGNSVMKMNRIFLRKARTFKKSLLWNIFFTQTFKISLILMLIGYRLMGERKCILNFRFGSLNI